ncbi:porin family protein [Chitinophaga sp. CB10]|uniref:porin family protein n=1 Tax=Chitinophaga sp. CB10 TaxID=1891659 RepID=UPI0025B91595|nr:porin family protein [Chitinophaga sp. CB10]
MSKRMILPLLLLAGCLHAYGQGLHFGAKAGANLFKITGEGIKPGYKPGIQLGLLSSWDFNRKVGVQAELQYSQANATRDANFSAKYISNNNPEGSAKVQLGYVTIPLLLKYNLNRYFTLNAGPEYSILFYSNEDLLMYNRDAFKRSNFGLSAGLTLNVQPVHFYGRFVQGLSNINGIDDRYQWKSQQIQVGIGVDIK